jgi:hypothetical protein
MNGCDQIYKTEFKARIHNWRTVIASTSGGQLLKKPELPRVAQLFRLFLLPVKNKRLVIRNSTLALLQAFRQHGMLIGLPLNISTLSGTDEIICTDCNYERFSEELSNSNDFGLISKFRF